MGFHIRWKFPHFHGKTSTLFVVDEYAGKYIDNWKIETSSTLSCRHIRG